jgi:hypothetical protein
MFFRVFYKIRNRFINYFSQVFWAENLLETTKNKKLISLAYKPEKVIWNGCNAIYSTHTYS